MDFDQMLEIWRAQNTAPPEDVNRDALRQALQTEEARVREEMRTRRRGLWIAGIVGTGMAVFAGFWIAITITNGWPAIYAIAAGVSFGMFTLGVGAMWMSRGPRAELERNFGNTLEEEVRRNLSLVDYQLSITRRSIVYILGAVFIVVGALLFSWTVNRSQNIPDSSGSVWFPALIVVWIVWVLYSAHKQMRKARPKLEFRQRRLRELLAGLDGRE